MKYRVAIIFHRIGPYHIARLKSASKMMDVVAVELSEKTEVYKWEKVELPKNISHKIIFKEKNSREASHKELLYRIEKKLIHEKLDFVLINGWSDKASIIVLDWCVKNKLKPILMSESNAFDFKRTVIKEWIKSRLVANYYGAIVGGINHKRYLLNLGMKTDNIVEGYDVVDNEFFRNPILKNSTETRLLPNNYILSSNRFIKKKNLENLLEAYYIYVNKVSQPWDLVMLGDGPLRSKIEDKIVNLKLQKKVHLLGFKQINELPTFYKRAKLFIHVSTREQWGLVVNEAMSAGLPIIVSSSCGCAKDLVYNEINGYIVNPLDTHEIALSIEKIQKLDKVEYFKMSEASSRIICRYEPEIFGQNLYKLINKVGKSKIGYDRKFDKLLFFLLKRIYGS